MCTLLIKLNVFLSTRVRPVATVCLLCLFPEVAQAPAAKDPTGQLRKVPTEFGHKSHRGGLNATLEKKDCISINQLHPMSEVQRPQSVQQGH